MDLKWKNLQIHGMQQYLVLLLFAVGTIFPMLTIVFLPASYRIPATVIVVALALLGTGYTSAKLGKAPIKMP